MIGKTLRGITTAACISLTFAVTATLATSEAWGQGPTNGSLRWIRTTAETFKKFNFPLTTNRIARTVDPPRPWASNKNEYIQGYLSRPAPIVGIADEFFLLIGPIELGSSVKSNVLSRAAEDTMPPVISGNTRLVTVQETKPISEEKKIYTGSIAKERESLAAIYPEEENKQLFKDFDNIASQSTRALGPSVADQVSKFTSEKVREKILTEAGSNTTNPFQSLLAVDGALRNKGAKEGLLAYFDTPGDQERLGDAFATALRLQPTNGIYSPEDIKAKLKTLPQSEAQAFAKLNEIVQNKNTAREQAANTGTALFGALIPGKIAPPPGPEEPAGEDGITFSSLSQKVSNAFGFGPKTPSEGNTQRQTDQQTVMVDGQTFSITPSGSVSSAVQRGNSGAQAVNTPTAAIVTNDKGVIVTDPATIAKVNTALAAQRKEENLAGKGQAVSQWVDSEDPDLDDKLSRARSAANQEGGVDKDYNANNYLDRGVRDCRVSNKLGMTNCDTTASVVRGAQVYEQLGSQAVGMATQAIGNSNQYEAIQKGTGSATYEAAAKNHQFVAQARLVKGIGSMALALAQKKRATMHEKDQEHLAATADKARGNGFLKGESSAANKDDYGTAAGDSFGAKSQEFYALAQQAGRSGKGQSAGEDGYLTAAGSDEESKTGNKILQGFRMNEDYAKALPEVKGKLATCAAKPGATPDSIRKCQSNVLAQQVKRNQTFLLKRKAFQGKTAEIAETGSYEQARNADAATEGQWASIFTGFQDLVSSGFGFRQAKEVKKQARQLAEAEQKYQDSLPKFEGDPLPEAPATGNRDYTPNATGDTSAQTAQTSAVDDGTGDPALNLGDPFNPNLSKDGVLPGAPPGTFAPSAKDGGGAGGGVPGLGSGQTSPADVGSQETPGARYADDLKTSDAGYIAGGGAPTGGGYRGGGSAATAGGDSGLDLSQLAKLLPGQGEQEDPNQEKKYRVDFGGNRNIAGYGDSHVLDRDTNIFKTVNDRYHVVKKQGRL